MLAENVLIRRDDRSAKRGASRRGRVVSGASKPSTPFDWSRVIRPIKRIIIVGLVVGVCIFSYQKIQAYRLESLTIKTVHINGERQYENSNAVTKIIGAYTNDDFFNLKIEAMRDHLMEVSWVKSVSLRKEWPDRLVVNIQEHHPFAHWQDEHQRDWLLSKRGVKFESEFALPQGMPVLSGQNVDIEKVMRQYKHVSLTLLDKKLNVKKMNLNTRHEWLITLSNGVQVKYLDDDSDMAIERMLLALSILTTLQLEQVDTIDLRYEHGFAIRWREDKNV